jgi:hypothetical protein
VCKYKLGFEKKLRKDAFVIVASDIGKKFQNAWHQKYTTLIAELPLCVGIDYRPRFHWVFSQKKTVRFYSEPIKKHLFSFLQNHPPSMLQTCSTCSGDYKVKSQS